MNQEATDQTMTKNMENVNHKNVYADDPPTVRKSEQPSTMGDSESPFLFSTPVVRDSDKKIFQGGQWTGLSTDSGFSDRTVDTTWTSNITETPFSAQSLTSLSSIPSSPDSSPACGRRLTLTDNKFSPINRQSSKILQVRKLEFNAFDVRPPPLQFSAEYDNSLSSAKQPSKESLPDDTDMEIIGFDNAKYNLGFKNGNKNVSPSHSSSSSSPRSRIADDLEMSLQEMSLEEVSSSSSGPSPHHLKSSSPSPTFFMNNPATLQINEAEKELLSSEAWECDRKVCAQGEKISAMSLDDYETESTEIMSMSSSIEGLSVSLGFRLDSPVKSKGISHGNTQNNTTNFDEKDDFLSMLSLTAVNSEHSMLFSTPVSHCQTESTESDHSYALSTNPSPHSKYLNHKSNPQQVATNSIVYHPIPVSNSNDRPPIASTASDLYYGFGGKSKSQCYSTETLSSTVPETSICRVTCIHNNIPTELKSPSKRCRDSRADSESDSILLFSPTKAARRQLSPKSNYKQSYKNSPSPRKTVIRKILRDDDSKDGKTAVRKILRNDTGDDLGESQKVCPQGIQTESDSSELSKVGKDIQIQSDRTPQFLNLSSLSILPEKTEATNLKKCDKSRSPIHSPKDDTQGTSDIFCEKFVEKQDTKYNCKSHVQDLSPSNCLMTNFLRHSSYERFQAVLEKHSPAKPASLIGRNVGVRKFDVIQQLSCRQFTLCLEKIFQYLSADDLVRVSKVSQDWKHALHQVRQASDRYRNHLRLQNRLTALIGDGKENCGEKILDHHGQRLTASRGHLTPMQSQAVKTELPVVLSATEPKDDLLAEDQLKMCPHCQGLALVKPQQDRAVCLNTKCGFDFCTNCFTPFHHPRKCKPLFRAPSKAGVAGTRKSRNNLRRL